MTAQRGNLQDAINAHSINGTRFSEREMLRLFRGTCEAVRAMHDYHAPLATSSDSASNAQRQSNSSSAHLLGRQGSNARQSFGEDDENEMFPQPEGDGDDGYSYNNNAAASVPLVSNRMVEQGDVIFDGDEELADHGIGNGNGDVDPSKTQLVPYAHRDLKPG